MRTVEQRNGIWRLSLEQIEATVADHLGNGRVPGNQSAPCLSRQVSMYLAKNVVGWSTTKIGRFYNGRHHTTVLHAIEKIERLRQTDESLDALIEVIAAELSPGTEGCFTKRFQLGWTTGLIGPVISENWICVKRSGKPTQRRLGMVACGTMPKMLDPFRFVLISVAGWMNQQQQHAIEYLREENRVLRARLGNRRLRFTDDQRHGLAAKAKLLGRKLLERVATTATPDTLLNWHQKLIANKYDGGAHRSPGRPATGKELEALVVRMAMENRDWGYLRIRGALSNLGHELARSTIACILKRNALEPAPHRVRKTTWKEFLTRHWDQIAAADFFTVKVWTRTGLRRFFVLFFIELSTRRVHIAGISARANGLWMNQIARNLTDGEDGLLQGKRYLIHDRDPLFTEEFLATLTEAGVESVRLPPRSLNLNSYAERFVRSIKESCLERMILFGEASLRTTVREFVAHYHTERNHQGIGNILIVPDRNLVSRNGPVRCQSRLGGMLNYYDRAT